MLASGWIANFLHRDIVLQELTFFLLFRFCVCDDILSAAIVCMMQVSVFLL